LIQGGLKQFESQLIGSSFYIYHYPETKYLLKEEDVSDKR